MLIPDSRLKSNNNPDEESHFISTRQKPAGRLASEKRRSL
jgi:hypothetical protein